jgi:putative ABC transport system permease protein
MAYTIRSDTTDALGNIDEVISRSGAEVGDSMFIDAPSDIQYFPDADFARVEGVASQSTNIDGITPAIIETVGLQDMTSQQTEPRFTIFASDPQRMSGFGEIRDVSGPVVSLADLAAGEVFMNAEGADKLSASTGDQIMVYAADRATAMTVKAIVDYKGAATTESAILMPLAVAQEVLDHPGEIKHILISNNGGLTSGMGLTDTVIAELKSTLDPMNLEADPTKQDAIDLADETGNMFFTVFVTFGSFSVIAGMLLIFLIFVMLAQERKGEMGVARAVGAQRTDLAQAFTFEGVAYDLSAALVGAAAGVAIAYVMAIVLAAGLGDFADLRHKVEPRSIAVAYMLGALVTFAVITISAWRVSFLNIVRAIRDLPDPIKRRGESRGWILGVLAIMAGTLLAYSGIDGKQAAPMYLGISMVILGAIPVLRQLGIPDRIAYTVPGVILVIHWLLPFDTFVSDLSMDFTIFVLSGLFVVMGATWVVMYNSDVLIAGSMGLVGRLRKLAPIVKTAVAYPLTNKFRTGVTLAMFTLVVFTMVVMSITMTSFNNAFNDVQAFGGGYDIRATTVSSNPIHDPESAIASKPNLNPSHFAGYALQSTTSVKVVEEAYRDQEELAQYAILGFDGRFLSRNTYTLATKATGFETDREVWDYLRDHPGFGLVSQEAVQRRQQWGFSAGLPDFRLHNVYIEDESFEPVRVTVVDPQTAKTFTVTIIGVLSDTAPFFMTGITTSRATLDYADPGRTAPNALWFKLAPGTDASQVARDMESAFLANGMQADSMADQLEDVMQLNRTIDWILEGFMSLGLIVGVVAIGVISARNVVERRQQIGVLRAIGFQRNAVQASFLLESSLVAIIGIVLGSVLGVIIAYDVIYQASATPSWSNLSLKIPFGRLALIFALVYGAALVASWFPARQASRVYPAEALRYE